MRRLLSCIFSVKLCGPLFGALFSLSAMAADKARSTETDQIFKEALAKRLNFIFNDEALKRMGLGVEVYSLSRQESLYRLNAETPMSPASAIKLLTALAALKRLGPDYVYKTQVYVDGPIKDGTLKGNLYLKASGDPSLVTERLYLLVNEIQRSQIKTITGQIVVDDWTFDQISIDPKRIDSNTDRAYNAPIGGLNFNYNTTTVYFRPGESVGDKPIVSVDPDTGYINVVNQAKTGRRGSGYKLISSRNPGSKGDTIVVRGTIPQGFPEQRSFFNITQPKVYAGQALRFLLGQRGVRVVGSDIKHGQVPVGAKLIATLDSLPLRDIVILMNKFSNNFIADTLVKTLGRELKGAPGTMEKGLQVLMEESTKLGINSAGYTLVSGSGLTRDNRMTAAQFISLMNAAYLDFDVLPELLASMPIAGKDGTLRSRMKGTSAYGRLRGKTGTLDGVSSLVGVVQSRGGELLSFAVMMNDRGRSTAGMKPWQNFFGQALADFNRKVPLPEKPGPLPDVLEEAPADESMPPDNRGLIPGG